MDKEKAEKIMRIYNRVRFVLVVLFILIVFIALLNADG